MEDVKGFYRLLALALALCLAGCSSGAKESALSPTTTAPTQSLAPITTPATASTPGSTSIPATTPAPTQPPPEIIQPEPQDDAFVRVRDYIPGLIIDLRYATEHNFTGQQIYGFRELWLRYGTVKKLMLVQEELRQKGLSLKVWDGFRPASAQFRLWDICPDPKYVSNPHKGFSSHSRGNTVDITLVDRGGKELEMPTGFDDFSALADRDYSDCPPQAAENARLLEQLMLRHGFKPYSGEWWHFSDTQAYPVAETFEPVESVACYADCEAYITLRTAPSISAPAITTIAADEAFHILALHGDFALVEYKNLLGYVLRSYAQSVP